MRHARAGTSIAQAHYGEDSQMAKAPRRVSRTLRATLLAAVFVLAPLPFTAAAQVTGPKTRALIIPSMYGQDLFDFYCASCHGRDGKGRGPVVPALTVSPPDLTLLTARHGGTFPRAFVESFVTGNRAPAAHGSKDMPVWGPIFLALDPNAAANKVRIENIVAHIESIQNQQDSTSPRLLGGRMAAGMPSAFGGGAVVLEVMVDAAGGIARIGRLLETPPYTDLVVNAVSQWRFTPATDRHAAAGAGPVLVVAVFRPPLVYAGPAPDIPRGAFQSASARIPSVESIVLPLYPPTAIGDGMVVVEIEISGASSVRGYRIVSPDSGFDSAALDAARSWRFQAPRGPDVPDRTFVYAVMGFRAPLATTLPGSRR
jgi:TonB family protein